MKYRLYIDEVGNADLGSSDDPNHRFLSLTGVAVALDHVDKVIHPELESLKRAYFGSHPDDPIIFHRKEMVNAHPPFAALADDATRSRFDADVLAHLARWEYTVFSVCIDKKKHRETYTTWRYDPYHYCLAVLLERFVFFLDGKNAQGDVLAESRGGKEDRRLKDSFENLWTKGTQFLDAGRIQKRLTSRQLKVKTKANNIAGLQLADLIAHPSRAEILHESKSVDKAPAPFAAKVIAILAGKYYQSGGRQHGKKML
ncbi:MAG: DUF3800 domain-containing protein [Phycisphaeraceae bacterium]|nr:DUF3800 domain-containing protein [Phycisphaeraceae bacterium]